MNNTCYIQELSNKELISIFIEGYFMKDDARDVIDYPLIVKEVVYRLHKGRCGLFHRSDVIASLNDSDRNELDNNLYVVDSEEFLKILFDRLKE